MLDDALLDLSDRGDIVIDPFLGSGSPLIVELDLLYIYVIALIRGRDTQSSGFSSRPVRRSNVLAARRSREAAPRERALASNRVLKKSLGGGAVM
jgi:hypothetical protein